MSQPHLQLGSKLIARDGGHVYIVAEIGQNHQGSMEMAMRMITEAKLAGCDCVKFQKSDLSTKFTAAALNRPYDSPNSFGPTYGEHKAYLEFSMNEFRELQEFAEDLEIDFTASAMDEQSLEQLCTLNVPFIKIGSGDNNNFPMMFKAAAMCKQPLIISTGMQYMSTIDRVVEIMNTKKKQDFALLHCVSAYPTSANDANLQIITMLRKRFPNCVIGYSGHELGTDISVAAVLLGAKIVERHFTLDKTQKGSDHQCSLDPAEMRKLVETIRKLESRGELDTPYECNQILATLKNDADLRPALKAVDGRVILPNELSCKHKLGKSLVAARHLAKGTRLQPEDVCVKVSEPNGIEAERYFEFLNLILAGEVRADEPITLDKFQLEE